MRFVKNMFKISVHLKKKKHLQIEYKCRQQNIFYRAIGLKKQQQKKLLSSAQNVFIVHVDVSSALPVVVPVQLKHLAGGIRRLSSVEHVHAGLQSGDSGVVLRNTHTHTHTIKTLMF